MELEKLFRDFNENAFMKRHAQEFDAFVASREWTSYP